MVSALRKIPPVCLVISIIRLLSGKLRYSKTFIEKTVTMQDGQKFTIFRHITTHPITEYKNVCVFIVSFKFARLSHKANKIASKIPMLLITGFPGFVTKIYTVNNENGYWQGMYQWESKEALDEYKKSFVFKMMNKRAIKSSLKSTEFEKQQLIDFIIKHIK